MHGHKLAVGRRSMPLSLTDHLSTTLFLFCAGYFHALSEPVKRCNEILQPSPFLFQPGPLALSLQAGSASVYLAHTTLPQITYVVLYNSTSNSLSSLRAKFSSALKSHSMRLQTINRCCIQSRHENAQTSTTTVYIQHHQQDGIQIISLCHCSSIIVTWTMRTQATVALTGTLT